MIEIICPQCGAQLLIKVEPNYIMTKNQDNPCCLNNLQVIICALANNDIINATPVLSIWTEENR
jgi:ssDNA-binding Zn-finger/Zn-ribbon topoisomerase 1